MEKDYTYKIDGDEVVCETKTISSTSSSALRDAATNYRLLADKLDAEADEVEALETELNK